MSKFFRSADSDSSSSDESSSDEQDDVAQAITGARETSVADEEDSSSTYDISRTLNQLSLPKQSDQDSHRDLLLHALLEDHCINEVLKARLASGDRRASKSDPTVQNEAQANYRHLSNVLAGHNLVSPGLEHDHMRPTRQRYRDGLSLLSRNNFPSSSTQANIPVPLRRLLTDSSVAVTGPTNLHSSWPWDANRIPTALDAITPSHPVFDTRRYLRDFDELGVLGKGGYGMVFHVRNKLDNLQYAVKKVPISPSRFRRIQSRGQPELDDLLVEVRTLAKLDHPNIVRYHAGWIEWSDIGRTGNTSASGFGESVSGFEESSANPGAEDNSTESLRRVFTESNSAGYDVLFENSLSQQPSRASRSGTEELTNALNDSVTDGALVRTSEPTLALHLQMGLYPLTLADFISPSQRTQEDEGPPPLTHCFHLQPSIDILLAILEGVEYLHAEDIVHRDLKPANIFMGANPNPRATTGSVDLFLCSKCRAHGTPNAVKLNVRIGDFGLVTDLGRETGEIESESLQSQPRMSPVGTEIYRPLVSMSSISPTLDIFALGIIAFEMLWRFGTRMERHDTLQRLKRGQFPSQFSVQIDDRAGQVERLIRDMLRHEETDQVSVQQLKSRLLTIRASFAQDRANS